MKKTLFMVVCLLSFFGAYGLLRAKADTTSFPAQGAAGFVIGDNVLLEYRGHEAKVVIPDGVKAIGAHAFSANKNIVDVVLPEGVERIEEGAFRGCAMLENVQLPESLSYIGKMAFMHCEKLEKINLSSVKEIGDHAFESSGLTYVDLTAVEKLGTYVFTNTEIDFSGLGHLPEMEGNAFFLSRGWWEYGKEENTFWIVDGVLLSGQNCRGAVKIPNTVTKIAAEAFNNNKEITSVYIPDSVMEIGESAFWYCTELKKVWMEDSVTKLGEVVFVGCSELAEVRLSNRIRVLPEETFRQCVELERLTLPEDLTDIKDSALPPVPNKKVTVPDGIRRVGSGNRGQGDTYYTTGISRVSGFPAAAVQELELHDTELTLHVGREYSLYFNSGANATWKSSKESVAKVGVTGNVRAQGEGMAVITATIYGKDYTCNVKVIDGKVDFFPCRNNGICAHIQNMQFEKHW